MKPLLANQEVENIKILKQRNENLVSLEFGSTMYKASKYRSNFGLLQLLWRYSRLIFDAFSPIILHVATILMPRGGFGDIHLKEEEFLVNITINHRGR